MVTLSSAWLFKGRFCFKPPRGKRFCEMCPLKNNSLQLGKRDQSIKCWPCKQGEFDLLEIHVFKEKASNGAGLKILEPGPMGVMTVWGFEASQRAVWEIPRL